MRARVIGAVVLLCVLAALGGASALTARLVANHHRPTVTFARLAMAPAPLVRHAVDGNARWRLSAVQVQRQFAAAYARFLDGRGEAERLTDASLTVQSQAHQGGRVPATFRDGQLAVTSIRDTGYSDYSAVAEVVVADRQLRYPFTISLLRETGAGWIVTELDPPDLSVDVPVARLPSRPLPAAAQRAARAFAGAYVAHYDRTHARLPAMTATARGELANYQDPLYGHQLTGSGATVSKLAYGPLEGRELAVTATVRDGQTVTFTFLLMRLDGVWSCDAFL